MPVDPEFQQEILAKIAVAKAAGGTELRLTGITHADVQATEWVIAQLNDGEDGLPHLTTLDLTANLIGEAGAVAIAQGLKQLTMLNLGCNGIGDAGAVAIAQGLKQLATLDLWGNGIGEAGAMAIAQGLPQLITLDLAANEIGEAGAMAIAQGLPLLTTLILRGNEIGGAGAVAIAQGLKQLTTLDLGSNGIGEAGAVAIAQGLKQLTMLNLGGNRLGDAGAVAIVQGLPLLTILELGSNVIGEAGATAIAQSIKHGHCPNLKSLGLFRNDFCIDGLVLLSLSPTQIAAAILGTSILPAARIMFVGMGEVGKSCLANRLFLGEVTPTGSRHKRTDDFELLDPTKCKFTYQPQIELQGRDTTIFPHVWDLGGQPELHGLHETFLGNRPGYERTVYVLVLAASKVPGSQFGPHDQWDELGNALPYWLKMLARHAGPTAPVVIAITQCGSDAGKRLVDEYVQVAVPLPMNDERADGDGRANEPVLQEISLREMTPEGFRKFGVNVVAIVDQLSATQDTPKHQRAIEELKTAINAAVKELTPILSGRVPPKLVTLKTTVEAELRPLPTANFTHFKGWCEQSGFDTEQAGSDSSSLTELQQSCLRILDELGSLFFFGQTEREERMIREEDREYLYKMSPGRQRQEQAGRGSLLESHLLNPRWIKSAAYQIAVASKSKRVFTLDEFRPYIQAANRIIDPDDDGTVVQAQLKLLRDFLMMTDLCWEEKKTYHFPRGFEAKQHDKWTTGWKRSWLGWRFLPESAFFRLIVKIHENPTLFGTVVDHYRHSIIIESAGVQFALVAHFKNDSLELRFPPATDFGVCRRLVERIETALSEKRLIGEGPVWRDLKELKVEPGGEWRDRDGERLVDTSTFLTMANPVVALIPDSGFIPYWGILQRINENMCQALKNANRIAFWTTMWTDWQAKFCKAESDLPVDETVRLSFADLIAGISKNGGKPLKVGSLSRIKLDVDATLKGVLASSTFKLDPEAVKIDEGVKPLKTQGTYSLTINCSKFRSQTVRQA